MNCEEYLLLISGRLDGANSEFEERCLQEHLQTCASCRALLSQMEENDALLKNSAAAPPADLTERIMREVRKEKQAASSRKKRWIPIAASGLAAAALLSLVVWGNLPITGTSKDSAVAETKYMYAENAPAETAKAEGDMIATGETGAVDGIESPVYGSVPELPANSTVTADAANGTTLKGSIEHASRTAPMLIVWNADPAPDALADCTLAELDEYAPLAADLTTSLYARYQAVIPVLRNADEISPADGFAITVYTVPYETMTAVFGECIGVYENAVYYPAALQSTETCSVVLINTND